MTDLVYAAITAVQYYEAMFRLPPRIHAIAPDHLGEDAETRIFGGPRIILNGEIPAAYFSSERHDIVLGFKLTRLTEPQRFDFAALQHAVLIEADGHEPMSESELALVRSEMNRPAKKRDTAYAVSELNPHHASYTGIREGELLSDLMNAIDTVPEQYRGGFSNMGLRYLPLERAVHHQDAPLPEPAYFRRCAEASNAA